MITSVLKNALAVYCFLLVTRGRRSKTSFFIYLIFILIRSYRIYYIYRWCIDKANLETRVSGLHVYVTTELGTLLKYTAACDIAVIQLCGKMDFKNIHYHITSMMLYRYTAIMPF